MPSDTQSFKHGEEGTHWCCQNRIRDEGGKATCCECRPHDGCGNDTHTVDELRPIREYLEDVTGVSHGDSEVESAWLEQIEDFIVQRERAAQLALIERLRMKHKVREKYEARPITKRKSGYNAAVDEFNANLEEIRDSLGGTDAE